ncbi:hypothetical protein JVU11DRAFT_7934 [Chiua virens]|nr:hypothetical protein JVU11DRAFT_7934 [Chiua virens]
MPRPFCIFQTFVIYYSAWSLTGVCAAWTFATSSTVLWPSSTTRSATLAWKNMYYLPILAFPLICLSISVPVLFRINAIQPMDDLHCDASHPEWGRFLGYAGFPIIPAIPCFLLSAVAARRIVKLHRVNQQLHDLTSERIVPVSESPASPVHSSDHATRASMDPEASPAFDAPSSPRKRSETWAAMLEEECLPQRQIDEMMMSSWTSVVPLPKPNLATAIWRLILFQLVFFIIQCLSMLSTIIDVARRRPTPTPFGSQHVALVLVGWAPAIIFGHLPAVRGQFMFWKK